MSTLSNLVVKKYDSLLSGVKTKSLTLEEVDVLSMELLGYLSHLTVRGVTEISEGVPVDKYKERVWNLIERVGLLPE